MRNKIKVGLALLLATLFAVPATPAMAGSKGRRNTAIVLSAFGLYHLAKGHLPEGIAGGAGATYAWKRYEDARRIGR